MYFTYKTLERLPPNKRTVQDTLFGQSQIHLLDLFEENQVQQRAFHLTVNIDALENPIDPVYPIFMQDITNFLYNFTDKNLYYRRFSIPKRKGGFRHLIEPQEELKKLQQDLLYFLQVTLQLLPHNAAHAYTKNRDSYTNAKSHKEHKCFITLDLKNFFSSITEEELKKQLMNNIILNSYGEEFINNIINLASLDGVLPQGSPLSPFLSNLFMMDFDYKLTKALGKELPYYTYTRYADDLCLSANAITDVNKIIAYIDNLLNECYNGTIKLNPEKTKVLKNTKRCYITGIKINKDNHLTYGHENKTKLKLEIYNLFQSYRAGTLSKEEAQEVLGRFSYMARIERDYSNYIQRKMLRLFNSHAPTIYQHFRF